VVGEHMIDTQGLPHATLTLTNFLLGGGKSKSANPSIGEIGKNEGQFFEI
jgi:hypothetical protein